MNHKLFLIVSALTSFLSLTASADQDLIQIAAEKYPGKIFHMGIRSEDNVQIKGFYYDDEKLVRHEVSLAQAKKGLTLITMASKNPLTGAMSEYEVVKLAINYKNSSQSAPIQFSYLHNGATGEYTTDTMKLVFDPHVQQYRILNVNDRPVTQAKVWTRKVFGAEIGIDRIDFN